MRASLGSEGCLEENQLKRVIQSFAFALTANFHTPWRHSSSAYEALDNDPALTLVHRAGLGHSHEGE